MLSQSVTMNITTQQHNLTEIVSDEIIKEVYEMLQARELHPTGKFDKQGRFYAKNSDLIDVRSPSYNYPYSELVACRTKKYVKKVAIKYNCRTLQELINCV